ncbi:J domain-containing protein [Frondihabitans cladoniiphilus]|uniref:J domain-containing protein n=1 Tax=Frondihabitans cladoniiphilus TaxID=715785 RepID=A0ABP8WBE4_9MICO
MTDSPASATPYEVLGVSAAASQEELRRAYRKLARETHPDLGGSPERFRRVQLAWERIGTAEDRAAFDRGQATRTSQPAAPTSSWAPAAPRPTQQSRPRARAYGHPGGRARELYLTLLREWVGRGEEIDDPYDPVLVRSAPGEIRRCLAKALAEEATATTITELGIGYTIWSDVAAGAEEKIDHVVLAPTGLYAIRSDDWGGTVTASRGEIVGEGVAVDEQPVRALARSARAFTKRTRVPFVAQLIVVPDDDLVDPVEPVSLGRRNSAFLVRRSVLAHVLRGGLTGGERTSSVDVFEIRSRLTHEVEFV